MTGGGGVAAASVAEVGFPGASVTAGVDDMTLGVTTSGWLSSGRAKTDGTDLLAATVGAGVNADVTVTVLPLLGTSVTSGLHPAITTICVSKTASQIR